MANILSYPDGLSLALNLKKFVIESNADIRFKLYQGTNLLIDEAYSPAADGKISIDVREIVKNELSFNLPTTDIFLQTNIIKEFTAYIDEDVKVFKAIRTGVENLSVTGNEFLTQNFLTWQPQSKQVGYSQPEWLTYYAPVAGSFKVKFYLSDGSSAIQTLAVLAAGSCTSVNMMFSRIMALQAGEKQGYFDVWIENAAAERLTYIQRYVYKEIESVDEHFLFENSLGGIDTVVMSGESVFTPDITHSEGFYDEESEQFDDSITRLYQKSTGWKTKIEAAWMWDFFRSIRKYKIDSGVIRKITIKESDVVDSTFEDMKSFSFTYRISTDKGLLNIPRSSDPLPSNLEITTPEGLFFLAPRLSEFPSAEFVDEFLLPVQSPFVQSWMKISLGAFRQGILDSISDITSPLAHTHTWESITGKPLTFSPSAHNHTWESIQEKPASFTPSAHNHTWESIQEKPLSFAPSAHNHTWESIQEKPLSFTPSAHNHTIEGVTGLSNALSGKEPGLGNPGTDGQILSSTVAGVRSWVNRYVLPAATAAILGGVMIGTGISASAQGLISHSDFSVETGIGGTLGHVKSSERSTWNNHIADNSSHLSSDERTYFNKLKTYFLFAADNSSVRTTINFYSESGVSCFGIGPAGSGGGSSVNVIDNLISTSTTEALSANMGRYLSNLVASKSDTGHSHTWESITGKPVTFAPSAHTHDSYALISALSNYLGVSANPNTPINGNFAIGSYNGRNFIQSHSEQPLDLNPLGNAVTINGYVPLTSGNYSSYALPLAGGTLTSTSWNPLSLDTMASSSYLALKVAGVAKGYLGWFSSDGIFIQNAASPSGILGVLNDTTPYYSPNGGTTKHTLIHSGNIGSQSVNYATIAGNADLLDGYHASSFALVNGSGGQEFYALNVRFNQTQYDFTNYLAHQNVYPMSLKLWNNYDGSGVAPSDYGTLLDVYGQVGHTHSQLYFGRGDVLKTRSAFYGSDTWGSWQTIYHTANLTQNLNAGNLPYWNGSTMMNSGISYSSGNIYSNGRTFVTDGTNYISIGQWDGVNNRIEGVGRPIYITSYTDGVKMGYAGYVDFVIDSTRGTLLGYTANPGTYKLAVNGTSLFNDSTYFWNSNGGLLIRNHENNSVKIDSFWSDYSVKSLSLNSSGGSVYIGYTQDSTPFGYKLVVNGAGYFNGNLSNLGHFSVKGVGNYIWFDTLGAEGSTYMGTVNSYDFRIQNTRGTGCRLDLNNNGFVDILGALHTSSDIISLGDFWSKYNNTDTGRMYFGISLGARLFYDGVKFDFNKPVYSTSYIESTSYLKAESVKLGNWEFSKNGDSEIFVKLNGNTKAKINSAGDILAYGGVSCFAL